MQDQIKKLKGDGITVEKINKDDDEFEQTFSKDQRKISPLAAIRSATDLNTVADAMVKYITEETKDIWQGDEHGNDNEA